MSTIRFALLALLSQGPAYGLQLRNELDRRLNRPKPTNVGQIYSTLDRLMSASLVRQRATTADGLSRYELTPDGANAMSEWAKHPHIDPSNRWESMVAQVALVRSLPNQSSEELLRGTRAFWTAELERALDRYSHDLAADLRTSAEEQLCLAALAWLDRVHQTSDAGVAVSQARPAKGRPSSRGR